MTPTEGKPQPESSDKPAADPDKIIARVESMFSRHSQNSVMSDMKDALITLAEEGVLNE